MSLVKQLRRGRCNVRPSSIGLRASRSLSPVDENANARLRSLSSSRDNKYDDCSKSLWCKATRGALILAPPFPEEEQKYRVVDLTHFHSGGEFLVGRPPSRVLQAAMQMCEFLDNSLTPHQSQWGPTRRLVTTVGSPEFIKHHGVYSFSGKPHTASDWEEVPGCQTVVSWASTTFGQGFSMCHVNKYTATDSKPMPGLSAHADDEKQLLGGARIVCLSLGNQAMRVTFRDTSVSPPQAIFDHIVTPSTFYVMGGNLQSWSTHQVHALSKTQADVWGTNHSRSPDTRWSLTFRQTSH